MAENKKELENKQLSRRDFIRNTGILAGSAAIGATFLGGCTQLEQLGAAAPDQQSFPEYLTVTAQELEASVVETEAIISFDREETYDVIIVGAGTTGIPAAIAAMEEGASVAVLQKEATVMAQGMLAAKVVLEESDEAGVIEYVHDLHATYDHRGDFALNKLYAYKSGEAIDWFEAHLKSTDFNNYKESDSKTHVFAGGRCHIKGMLFPESMFAPMKALAKKAEEKGVVFYFSTPAVQLIKENDAVKGVVGKTQDGKYIKFIASKGVILATGDYQNNQAMVRKYLPDADFFGRKQVNKTGDGHLMGMLAGAQIEPITHTKMVHGGAGMLREEPLLALNRDGKRFMYEDVEYGRRATILRNQPGNLMISIFDDEYDDDVFGWGSDPTVPTVANGTREKLAEYIEKGVIVTADTLEELIQKLELPLETALASIKRYNELCRKGVDLDFGKAGKYMKAVDKAPFYAQIRKFDISAIPAGLMIDENGQCKDKSGAPIPGLYAAGNCSGPFYGDVDYSLSTMGLSIGRCITFGYLTGKSAAKI